MQPPPEADAAAFRFAEGKREPELLLQGARWGSKFVKGVDQSGFLKIAEPIQDKTAATLGPHAVELLKLVREVK